MEKFDICRVTEGLTTYAIERQNGFERRQQDDIPTWIEQWEFYVL